MDDTTQQLYEQSLVLRSQIGDEAAFEQLMALEGPRVGLFTRNISEDTAFDLDMEEVQRGLAMIPHEQREILVLRFFEDLSYEDLARATGCALGTVRSRVHYALRRRQKPGAKSWGQRARRQRYDR